MRHGCLELNLFRRPRVMLRWLPPSWARQGFCCTPAAVSALILSPRLPASHVAISSSPRCSRRALPLLNSPPHVLSSLTPVYASGSVMMTVAQHSLREPGPVPLPALRGHPSTGNIKSLLGKRYDKVLRGRVGIRSWACRDRLEGTSTPCRGLLAGLQVSLTSKIPAAP